MKRTISRALALAVIITAMLPSAGTAPPPDGGPAMMIESPVATTGFWTGLGPVQSTQMGISLAIGDVNGDGIDDVIAGGHDYARDYLKEGAVFVFFGPLSGTTMSPSLTITGGGAFFRLGWAVGVGDFNADGYDDIIAGYYGYENSALIEPGRVQVHYGGPGGPSSTPDWSAESDRDNTFFGTAVAAGDVNGDGFDDAIVGAESFDVTVGSSEGRVYLFRGSANGLENDAGWTYLGTPGSSTGYSVAAAGDVNGDGYGDLLIGGIRDYAGGDNNGYVALIPGAADVPAANPIWTQVGVNGDFLGSAVSTAGDVNGDLFADVLVSNTHNTVFLYRGGVPSTGLETVPAWTMTVSSPTQTSFGEGGLISAGDVNGDGFDDALIGANSFTGDLSVEGAAFLFLSNGLTLSTEPIWSAEGDQVGSGFGWRVGVGDLNGDAGTDLVVGAHSYTGTLFNQGRITAYAGSPAVEILDPNCTEPTWCPGELAYLHDTGTDVVLDPEPENLALANVYRRKVATDGVTRLLIRKPSDSSLVTFSLLDDQGNPAGPEYGELTSLDGTSPGQSLTVPTDMTMLGSFAFAGYLAPADFPGAASDVSGGVHLEVRADAGVEGVASVDLRLVPPPVVLVHGVWSNAAIWTKPPGSGGMQGFLKDQGFMLCDGCAVEYGKQQLAPSFDPLSLAAGDQYAIGQLVKAEVDSLRIARSRGVAVTQVDVVGHSLGGLVARARTKSAIKIYEHPTNYNQGSIHKIITIGTPHLGSRFADWLLENKCAGLPGPFKLENLLESIGKPVGKAIFGLQERSPFLQNIGTTETPVFTIVGLDSISGSVTKASLDGIIWLVDRSNSIDNLLGGPGAHDTIVPVTSQKANSETATTRVFNVVHARVTLLGDVPETESTEVWDEVATRLLAPIDSFKQVSFSLPPGDPIDNDPCPIVAAAEPAPSAAAVQISPPPGTVVRPGETVTVQFSIDSGNPVDGAVLGIGGSLENLPGPGPFEISFVPSPASLGRLDIVAFTYGPGPENYFGETYLDYLPDTPLTAIDVIPGELVFSVPGDLSQLQVSGTFGDGTVLDLTAAGTGTIYATGSGGTSIVSVSADGLVEAIADGEESILVTNEGSMVTVGVTVLIRNYPPVLNSPADVTITAGEVIELPFDAIDPGGDSLQLSAPQLPAFGSVIDHGDGTGLLTFAPGASEAGTFEVILAANDTGVPPLGDISSFEVTVLPCLPPPATVASLTVATDLLTWLPVQNASWYDVVGGSVMTLLASGGDFSTATTTCLASDQAGMSVPIGGDPSPGESNWYLVRPESCGGIGTFDSNGLGQVASRDTGIGQSAGNCP